MNESNQEFEVKVLSIDLSAIREKLEEIGKLDRQQVSLHDFFFENDFTKAHKSTESGISGIGIRGNAR